MTHCTPLECGSLGLWCAIDMAIRWIGRGGKVRLPGDWTNGAVGKQCLPVDLTRGAGEIRTYQGIGRTALGKHAPTRAGHACRSEPIKL